ncbi:erythrocyte membrane protein, putative [Plasmodium knowlesi strain H]|uniref:Erythrocyte membrane protein, putative n=3 Tax=Plasmodium knowlesi TaxID=5850 RepID=A0A5K1UH53_PLAKH|nr:conserved Plasmodium protein, unknown function [Plasmodium knowlesi strain H]OTN68731.1 putative Erythrocyte membrane protein [Plasmodium knowlesi]CAA9986134.1 conserved Plasmodium protein, unknown function [Plasmodium knowlesi strain H]SBO25311.1 erythrocyte membrane protein, putative [Plasmodium knowlesi strain H]SBO27630.1 erythrocyte membrane protein, putative [Plasmodium knowlesi strain H]VVS75608.1 conserved Plasmodium protein, unknown function [Plasmodium knowlesi strain H]|eukprot:XP_002257545.1 erythrocyte membrane protein, putative [Plasmodium knowlesi strain H]
MNSNNSVSRKKVAKNGGTAKGSEENVKDNASICEENCGDSSKELEQNVNEKSQAKCMAGVKKEKEEDSSTNKGDEMKLKEENQDVNNQKEEKMEEEKKKKKKNNKLSNADDVDNGSGVGRKKENQSAEEGSIEKEKVEEDNNASAITNNDNVSSIGGGSVKNGSVQGHGKGIKQGKGGNKSEERDPSGNSAHYGNFGANNDWRSGKNNNNGNHSSSSNHGGNVEIGKNIGAVYPYSKGNNTNGELLVSRDKHSDYNGAAVKDPSKKRSFVKGESKNLDGGYNGNASNGGTNSGSVGNYPNKTSYKYDYKGNKNNYGIKGGKNYKGPAPSMLSNNVSGGMSGNISGNFNPNGSGNGSGNSGGSMNNNRHNSSSLTYDGFNNHGSSNNPNEGMMMDPMNNNMMIYNNNNPNYNYLPNYACNYPYSYYMDDSESKNMELSNYYSSGKMYSGAPSSAGGGGAAAGTGSSTGGAGGAASGGTSGGASGTTPPPASTPAASSSATAGAVVPEGYNNDGSYDARFNYSSMMNDFYNYLPFNYYYYNMNNMYFGGSNYNPNIHNTPYHDNLKNRRNKKYLYDKNKKKNYKNMSSSNMYSEIKNRVIEIFKRENIMTDDYLLYFMYNNVKLSIDVIAKHPYISPLVNSNTQNNTSILANVLNDLKCINLDKKEDEGCVEETEKMEVDQDASTSQVTNPQVVTTDGKESSTNVSGSHVGLNDTSYEQDGEAKQSQEGDDSLKEGEDKNVAPPSVDVNKAEAAVKECSSLKREDNVLESDATGANEKESTVVEEMAGEGGGGTSSSPEDKSKNIEVKNNDKDVKEVSNNAAKGGAVDSGSNTKIPVEEDNKNFLLNLNNKRNVIIIRDINSHHINTIKSIVLSSPDIQGVDVLNIRNDVNNTIFITLRNEKKTESLAQYLKTKSVNDKKLNVRIKTTQKIQNIIENNIFKSTATTLGNSNNVSGSNQGNNHSGGSSTNASAMGTNGRGVMSGVNGAGINGGSTHGGSVGGTGVGTGSMSTLVGSHNSTSPNGVVGAMASSSSTGVGGSSTTNNAATATPNGSISGTTSGNHLNMIPTSGMPMGPKQYMNFNNMYYMPNTMNGYDSSIYGHCGTGSNGASNFDAYLNYYNYGMNSAAYNMYPNVNFCDSYGGGGYNMYSNAYGPLHDMKNKYSYNNNKGSKFSRGGGDGNNMGRVSDNNFNNAVMTGSVGAGAPQGGASGGGNNAPGYFANAYTNYNNVFSNMYGNNMYGNIMHSSNMHTNNMQGSVGHDGGSNNKGDKYVDDGRKFHHVDGVNDKMGGATSTSGTSHHHNRMTKGGKDADNGKGAIGSAGAGNNANSKNNRSGASENGTTGGKNNRSRSSSNCNNSTYNGNNNNNNNSGNNNGHGASSNRNGTNGSSGNGSSGGGNHGSSGGSTGNGGGTGSGGNGASAGNGNNCSSNNKSAMKTNGEYSKSGSKLMGNNQKLNKKDPLVMYENNSGNNSVMAKNENKAIEKKSGKNYYNKKNSARKSAEKKSDNKKKDDMTTVSTDLGSNEVTKMKDDRKKGNLKQKEDDNYSEMANQADHHHSQQPQRKKSLEMGESCEANEAEEENFIANSDLENDTSAEKDNEDCINNEEEHGKSTEAEKSDEGNNQNDDVIVEKKNKKDSLAKSEQAGSSDAKEHTNKVSARIGASKKNFANKIGTNKDKGAVNTDEKRASKNKNKMEDATVNGSIVNVGIATNESSPSGNTQNRKKYSYVDIMDSCKKLTNVDAPPECIDKLMKENVSLFRKRDDQFCWKLNVF